MAIVVCRSCGSGAGRIITVFDEAGGIAEEFCSICQPVKCHEKFAAPSDKKIWIGPEVRPKDYVKREDSLGIYYDPTPEATAELERNIFVNTDDKEAHERAIRKKRAEHQDGALTPEQIAEAVKRADAMIRPLIEDKERTFIV